MADILSLKESVLVYLDRSGGLKKLCENCKHFNGMRFRSTAAMTAKITEFLTLLTVFSGTQQTEAVYRFCIGVNPADVLELDPVLGDCVLHDPLKATALFQSVSENCGQK